MKKSFLSKELWKARWSHLRDGIKKVAPFVVTVLVTLIVLLIYNALAPRAHLITDNEVKVMAGQVMASATPPAAYGVGVYQMIQPSLVLIQTHATDKNGKAIEALGSGVIVDDKGDILTSLHVVVDATAIQVTFADGSQSSAQITTQQPANDIAVLQANQPPAQIVPATLGNPNAMSVGDDVYAVGNPFGLYSSLTAGVISGFGRTFQPPDSTVQLQNMIQIDTAVNPGNSGGPLLNRAGEVIGIVTGLINPTGQDVYIGIGFAVPINVAGGAVGSPPD
jgi:S1-C subfamily serine protease